MESGKHAIILTTRNLTYFTIRREDVRRESLILELSENKSFKVMGEIPKHSVRLYKYQTETILKYIS